MATGINVPLEVAAALSAGSLGLGAGIAVWAGKWRNRRMAPATADAEADPLGPLFRPATLSRLINRAERRQPRGGRAVLHGHIGGLAALEAQWDAPTRAAVRAQIAAVMRASLRRHDRIALGDGTFGEGFTILRARCRRAGGGADRAAAGAGAVAAAPAPDRPARSACRQLRGRRRTIGRGCRADRPARPARAGSRARAGLIRGHHRQQPRPSPSAFPPPRPRRDPEVA
ncbi:MAG: hypothetical protein KatS3mg120_0380 [Erythrobacter sp.]|nr:MAG: hypothetical protein KatS3mg120_0380 [Erythrobacter sp.]